ncbi:hypothetical protein B0H19DRAFT_1200493 [Mycena capillaripes]|nr:hypothetical protein B0H19DRAFT_1200493 [Mycena capillaripes]
MVVEMVSRRDTNRSDHDTRVSFCSPSRNPKFLYTIRRSAEIENRPRRSTIKCSRRTADEVWYRSTSCATLLSASWMIFIRRSASVRTEVIAKRSRETGISRPVCPQNSRRSRDADAIRQRRASMRSIDRLDRSRPAT